MKRILPAYLCLLSLSVLSPLIGLAQESEYRQLFNGQDLAGWYGNNPHTTARVKAGQRAQAVQNQQAPFQAHWSVEDGQLVNDGQGPYATTRDDFGDIELQLEYRTVPDADSGIYLRGTPQVQIWDTTEAGGKWDRQANYGSGGLFNNRRGKPGQLPLRLADKPFGQWNHFRIVQVGSRTWVEFNHQLVVDGAIMENFWDKERLTPLPARGPIHLQTHGGEIRWKNIRVREIQADEAISRLRGDDERFGFTSIFNGQDLQGWEGATADYEVVDGAIRCKPERGGVLFSEQEYENFVVRFEFMVPPGGNNGLAIRYPGQGRAAYDGMCELQILDDDADKYAELDPRQYHGSVYGMVPAHRGYLRPAGQWNFQEVTVDGSHIRVELNGTVIVDADLAQVTDYKDGLAHPGKNLKRGHFGFAGHRDPVMFRRIAIKRLPNSPRSTVDPDRYSVFEANFQDVADANLSSGDGWIYTAESTKREEPQIGLRVPAVSIDEDKGVVGDALKFSAKTPQVVYYAGNEVNYSTENWQGSVSLWLKLDPDKDLEPGFCDPIQITQKAWNDASLFVDFDKELPRDFRLGVFPDYDYWNPQDTAWEDIPAAERPMITVENPPFSSDQWTHVCFTWDNINASDGGPASAKLFLNGELQGSLERPMQFTWDPDQVAVMLGLNYIGLMDELKIFRKALSDEEVRWLYEAVQK